MGLDMYLYRYPLNGLSAKEAMNIAAYYDMLNSDWAMENGITFQEWVGDKNAIIPSQEHIALFKKNNRVRYADWDKEKKYPNKSISKKVGYWRKANAIHNWFVENVQDGIDNCGEYVVTKEQLETLLDICETVLGRSHLKDGYVKNGYQSDDTGKLLPCYEEGKYVSNTATAEALLPTTGGFFFGSTDYDQWYIEDLKSTVSILKKVLRTTDFSKYVIAYSSSW